jgi:ArsR family transcriptional regulator
MDSASFFRLLGDEARLRILRLLDAERLNVTELTSILGIAQSGVSRHLGLLKDAGLVEERRDAGFTYFRLASGLQGGDNGFGPVWPLLQSHFETAAASAEGRADEARLEEVRRVRKENFDDHGADGERSQIVPGRSWAAWARALGHLLPPLVVADLGCGDGYLTIELSRFAKKVVAVDRSEAALTRAKQLATRLGRRDAGPGGPVHRSAQREGGNVEWKRGELEKLPLKDASVDVALLSQALHHADVPEKALAEAVRIVKPGGRVLLLELRGHQEHWVRDRLGDKWLGFADDS